MPPAAGPWAPPADFALTLDLPPPPPMLRRRSESVCCGGASGPVLIPAGPRKSLPTGDRTLSSRAEESLRDSPGSSGRSHAPHRQESFFDMELSRSGYRCGSLATSDSLGDRLRALSMPPRAGAGGPAGSGAFGRPSGLGSRQVSDSSWYSNWSAIGGSDSSDHLAGLSTSSVADSTGRGSLDQSAGIAAVLHIVDYLVVQLGTASRSDSPASIDKIDAIARQLKAGAQSAQTAAWRLLHMISMASPDYQANIKAVLASEVLDTAVQLCFLDTQADRSSEAGRAIRDGWIGTPLLIMCLVRFGDNPDRTEQALFTAMARAGYALEPALEAFFNCERDKELAAHAAFVLCLLALRGRPTDVAAMLAARSPAGVSFAETLTWHFDTLQALATPGPASFRFGSSSFSPPGVETQFASRGGPMLVTLEPMTCLRPQARPSLAVSDGSTYDASVDRPRFKCFLWVAYTVHFLVAASDAAARAAFRAAGTLASAAGFAELPVRDKYVPFKLVAMIGAVALYDPADVSPEQEAVLLPVLMELLHSTDLLFHDVGRRGLGRMLRVPRLQPAIVRALLEIVLDAGEHAARVGAADLLTRLAAAEPSALVACSALEPLLYLLQDDADESGNSLAVEPLAEVARNAAARAVILPQLRAMLASRSPLAQLRAAATVYKAAGKPAPALRKELIEHGIGELLVQLIARERDQGLSLRPAPGPASAESPQPGAVAAAAAGGGRSSAPADAAAVAAAASEAAGTAALQRIATSRLLVDGRSESSTLAMPRQARIGILLGAVLRLVALPAARKALVEAGLTRALIKPFTGDEGDPFVKKTASAVANFLRAM